MLTSSFGCTSSPASVASTSFAFMFDEVPEARLEDVDRELLVELAARNASAPAAIRSALSRSSRPRSAFHACRGALDAAEPARDLRRNRLAGDREVRYGLRGSRRPRALSAPVLLTIRV